jgi:hypothetical protein
MAVRQDSWGTGLARRFAGKRIATFDFSQTTEFFMLADF